MCFDFKNTLHNDLGDINEAVSIYRYQFKDFVYTKKKKVLL